MFGSNDDKKNPAAAGEKKGLFGWLRRKPQETVVEQPAPAPEITPEQRVKALSVVVVQGGQTFTNAAGLVQREQGTGIGNRRGIEHQRMAVKRDLAQWQAKTVFQQHIQQARIAEQLTDAFTGRVAAGCWRRNKKRCAGCAELGRSCA